MLTFVSLRIIVYFSRSRYFISFRKHWSGCQGIKCFVDNDEYPMDRQKRLQKARRRGQHRKVTAKICEEAMQKEVESTVQSENSK